MVFILLISVSCSSEGSDDDSVVTPPLDIIPSNLVLNIEIVGTDALNPIGDGSGVIQCTALATDATKYGFKFGSNPEEESVSGNLNFTFTERGTSSYIITVFAYSSTGHFTSTFKNISVYVNDDLQLVWADEFNTNGAPDSSKWNFEIGDGCPNLCGWGNAESQYYTDRADNVIVEDGLLKITAKKESYQGSDYTSTRMITKDKYEFT